MQVRKERPRSSARHIENDVTPEGEPLSDAAVAEVRTRCAEEVERGIRELVEAAPPRPPRRRPRLGRGDPSLYIGQLGRAFGFLHLNERTRDPEHLELARRYLEASRDAIERSGYPPPDEWLSFHGTGGVSAIAAVVHHRLGDETESRRHLEDYRRLAGSAADPAYPTDDLLWGRGGFLFGAAFLRAQLGPASLPDPSVAGALEAMIETGRRIARECTTDLAPGRHGRSPLVYLNMNRALLGFVARAVVGGRSLGERVLAALGAEIVYRLDDRKLDLRHRYDVGLAHGLLGNLYLLMHFPDLLRGNAGWLRDVRASLDVLTELVDAERGIHALLPYARTDAANARAGTGPFGERVHWCNGTPSAALVFARAHEVFGDEAYLAAALRAGEHVWRYGVLKKGNGICHGVAGNGYAFLGLFRATGDERHLHRALHFARHTWSERVKREQSAPDHRWSLYEGRMGTLCFYQDCLAPHRARFPAFEV